MHLLLTSAGFRMEKEIADFLPKKSGLKVLHVMTAAKREKLQDYMHKDVAKMKELGWQVTDIDLDGKTTDELRDLLKNADAVYVQGGNTFYLMYHAQKSGFEQAIREFLDRGGYYIGVSAGSIIAGTNVGIAAPEDPNDIGLTDMTGMGLVDLIISPHYEERLEEKDVAEFEERTGKSVLRLQDDQAVLVDGKKIKII